MKTKRIIASIYPCPYDAQIQHDFNSSVYKNGNIYSYEEGKLTGIKNDGSSMFSEKSLVVGMKQLNTQPKNVDIWVLPSPRKKSTYGLKLFFETFLKAYNKKKDGLFNDWLKKKVRFLKHHNLHTHAAIGASSFKKGVYLSIDGGGDDGDRRNFVWGKFNKHKLNEYDFLPGLEGIASFHAFITEFCGFRDQNGKTTGFSAYGNINDKLEKELSKTLIVTKRGIKFKRIRYKQTPTDFNHANTENYSRYKLINSNISKTNISNICKNYLPQDIAATAENLVTKKIITFLKYIKSKHFKKIDNIVFSGGFFLNVRTNNLIEKSGVFKNNFFLMSPSDSGLSLGGILSQKLSIKKSYLSKYGLSPYLGPSFSYKEILNEIKDHKLNFTKHKNIAKNIAKEISKNKIVGVFVKRAEFGQRSLGHRSILANPKLKLSREIINQKVKRRDWFMPFAPAILDKYFSKFFNTNSPSLYMQKAEKINNYMKEKIPSAVHDDGTCRAQYVLKKFSKTFWNIINEFRKISGIPAVLNTSFNRHGISTIATPRQAIEHLLEGCLDVLYFDNIKISLVDNRKIKKTYSKKILPDEIKLKSHIKLWKKKISKI